ncbi:MAG: sigma-54 dependent transcriptional regulator [Candidatus Omnitrophota bacterium]
MTKYRILVLNSDKLLQKSLYELLSRSGYTVDITDSIDESIACLEEKSYHLVLTDIDTNEGVELLKIIKGQSYPAEVLVLTSYGNIDNALDSVEMGAFDYLVKPVEDAKVFSAIEKALANKAPAEGEPVIQKINPKEETFYGLVGTMKDIYSLIERISNSKATILLRGESGTGKRVIARAIHQADKKRRDKPFIEMSCGALPREIIESELFGHTKGSFTGAINDRKGRFELAHGGTILLDDIDSFSLDLQVKLLRVLQQKEFERVGDHKTMKVDVRIIASTNQDLEKIVAEKKFREDLYYRLNVISINIPPLRKRKQDLVLLVNHFINLYAKENHKKMDGVSQDALSLLTSYDWPGNIRELENIIERAIILDIDNVIKMDDLPEIITKAARPAEPVFDAQNLQDTSSLRDALKDPEKVYILKILEEVGWNKKKAAIKLGVNRTTLYNKLRKYNLVQNQK